MSIHLLIRDRNSSSESNKNLLLVEKQGDHCQMFPINLMPSRKTVTLYFFSVSDIDEPLVQKNLPPHLLKIFTAKTWLLTKYVFIYRTFLCEVLSYYSFTFTSTGELWGPKTMNTARRYHFSELVLQLM